MSQKPQFSRPVKRQTLAEQVAEAIEESILAGDWEGGDVLPTEPELSLQFDVSRAVIRDATKMLSARGLVDVRHGRGVFVTESQTQAFGEALLLALRRSGASVWDVEHFEQILYPEVFALAAEMATDEELTQLNDLAQNYFNSMQLMIEADNDSRPILPEVEQAAVDSYRTMIGYVFLMSRNQVLMILAQPLLRLRTFRSWQGGKLNPFEQLEREIAYFQTIFDTISSGDPQLVRKTVQRYMELPSEAERVMRETPIGEVPVIQLPLDESSSG